jgi:hypothetical protein
MCCAITSTASSKGHGRNQTPWSSLWKQNFHVRIEQIQQQQQTRLFLAAFALEY